MIGKLMSWLLVVCCLLGIVLADNPKNRRRRQNSTKNAASARLRQAQAQAQAAKKQLAAARQVLAAAESSSKDAKAQLDSALAKLKGTSNELRDAESTSRELAKELAEIEREILDEAQNDPDFRRATKLVEATRAELEAIDAKILGEPANAVRLTGLTGKELADARQSIVDARPEHGQTRKQLDAAANDLSSKRRELFESDADWKEASEALKMARDEERDAEKKTRASGAGRVEASATIRNSSEAAAWARAAISRAEASLQAAERQIKANSTPAKNKAKNKK